MSETSQPRRTCSHVRDGWHVCSHCDPKYFERVKAAYYDYTELYIDPFWNWDARTPTFTDTQLPLWWKHMERVLGEFFKLGIDVEKETPGTWKGSRARD